MTSFKLDIAYSTTDASGSFELVVNAAWEARVTGLFGPSGSGKTTLLEALLGVRGKTGVTGFASVGGRTLFDTGSGAWLAPGERRFGWVPQDGALFPHLSVAGNLRLAPSGGGLPEDQIVQLLELGPLMKRMPEKLSGGERMRAALGRALRARHEVLLLDEPLASLDKERRQSLLALIRRLATELPVAIVYVSHDWQEIQTLCQHALVLDGGRLQSSGPPKA